MGVLYILDEPSIGLHQRDNHKLLDMLARLRDLGNTVIVVEHDEGTMRAADHIVDLGPGAGEHGGQIVARGPAGEGEAGLAVAHRASTWPASGRSRCRHERRRPKGAIEVLGAEQHNLKKIDVEFPLGVFCCVTGVSGSGKSTLVNEILFRAVANRLHRAKMRPGKHRKVTGTDRTSTRSSTSTSRRSAARRARTPPPTRACSTTSASCTRARRRAARAATSPAASRST